MTLHLELKTRPEIGSKGANDFGQMFGDVHRAARDPQTAFVFAFDEKLYGLATNDTGSQFAPFMRSLLPDLSAFKSDSYTAERRAGPYHFWVHARRAKAGAHSSADGRPIGRVIVAGLHV